jgi:hypothetical protein
MKIPAMKRILSFLLCIVFLKAQAFAIHGPLEGSDTGTILLGTYSGTLIPEDADQGTRVIDLQTGETTETLNSVGLFTVAIPSAGIGTGSFLIFTEGRSFAGTITAVGDPGAGTLTAILEATYEYTDFLRDDDGNILYQSTTINGTTSISPTSATFEAAVRGSLFAKVTSSITNLNLISAQTGNFGRIDGTAQTASVFVSPGGAGELVTDKVVRYTVDGVKQSITADAATQLTNAASADTGVGNLGLLGGLFGF